MSLSIIVAADLDNGIGKDNELLCHLPRDLKYFKQVTTGKTILMGYNTFLSIGRPLPNRRNVVLSRQTREKVPGVIFYKDVDECLAKEDSPNGELMIIGGGSLYKLTLERADKVYLTRIHHTFRADTFFPMLDEKKWQLKDEKFEARDDKNPYDLTFQTYSVTALAKTVMRSTSPSLRA